MKNAVLVLFAAMLLSACSKKTAPVADNAAPAQPAITAPDAPAQPQNTFSMPPAEVENPTNVVVSVNGEVLTAGEMSTEAALRLRSMGGASADPSMMMEMRNVVVDQFITRTILLNEAKRLELSASEEDLTKELESIKKMIPPETNLEEVLNESPLGREGMLDHIRNKIVVDKLVETAMKDKIAVTDAEVDKFIEEHKANLIVPESVEARHVLIQFGPDDDDKAKADKKTQADAIRKELLDGADFEKVAKEKSQCPSSEAGGFLGKFTKNQMVPEFSAAAFAQEVGKIGEVVTTKFGYHIIKVEKHEPEGMRPREDVLEQLKNLKTQTEMQKYIAELRAKADIKRFSNGQPVTAQPDPLP